MKFISISILALALHYVQGGAQDGASPPSAAAPPAKSAPKQEKTMRVIVDGKEVNFGANGVRTIGGRTFVPFRALFESMGCEVEYDLVHKKVTATKDNNEIELTVGDRIARKNGAEIMMEAAPQILKATTYVPLRFVAESLEAEVDYNGSTGVIAINTKGD